MKLSLLFLIFVSSIVSVQALVISEIMSNPIGDDSGREWIEVYNNSESDVDISSLTISIKGGNFVVATPVSGGTTLGPHMYGVIASIVSGSTRFTQDYPTYAGVLVKSSVSLVNTGVTSIEIKLAGVVADTISSYTAAKEGQTYSLINGSFSSGAPTPGEENKALVSEDTTPTTTTQTGNQTTIAQTSPPLADITLFLPQEKVVVAGAPSTFSVYSTTRAGSAISNMVYTWAFGDGGQSTGSSTVYRYLYPGRYIAQVEGTNGLIAGTGRIIVTVVPPDISITPIAMGKYGPYVDITNPNTYDLDLSLWRLSVDGALFTFPKNTLLAQGVTRFPGSALGFASTTISSSTLIKLLFQNMEEVLRLSQTSASTTPIHQIQKIPENVSLNQIKKVATTQVNIQKKVQTATPTGISKVVSISKSTSSLLVKNPQKDTRLVAFFRSFFIR